MQDLLDILRHQRHDFMNHLQVISGLLQLKKPERAIEYINEVAEKLKNASVISRISSAEIAIALLKADLAAQGQGVSINCSVTSNLDQKLSHSWAVAELLGEILDIAVREVEADSRGAGDIDLNIYNKGGEYVFEINLPCRYSSDNLSFVSRIVFIEETTAKINGRVNFCNSGDGKASIILAVPAASGKEVREAGNMVNI